MRSFAEELPPRLGSGSWRTARSSGPRARVARPPAADRRRWASEMAKPTFASVTEVRCTCGYLEGSANDGSSPIKFDSTLNEYHFEYDTPKGRGALLIYHCPFCGGTAPESKRDRLFAVISSDEEERLFALSRDVKTVEEALVILGPPRSAARCGLAATRTRGRATDVGAAENAHLHATLRSRRGASHGTSQWKRSHHSSGQVSWLFKSRSLTGGSRGAPNSGVAEYRGHHT
jgi:hypothetical protein